MKKEIPLIVLKVGGAVFTDRHADRPKLNRQNLTRIAREIGVAYDPDRIRLVFIHGAGSFGHPVVFRSGIHEGIRHDHQRIAFADTQRLQNCLDVVVLRSLIAAGVPAFPLQPSATAIAAAGTLTHFDVQVAEGLLALKMVPVLYGVPVVDTVRGCTILSGDRIAPFIGLKLGADRILHGTNVRGVFTDDPHRNPAAEFIPRIDAHHRECLAEWLKSSHSVDVTGGMYTKVLELLETGIPAQIFDAVVPGHVERALRGECIGTLIEPCRP